MKRVLVYISSILLVLIAIINVYFIVKSDMRLLNPVTEVKQTINEMGSGGLAMIIFWPIIFIIVLGFDFILLMIFICMTLGFILTMILGLVKENQKLYYVLFIGSTVVTIVELIFSIMIRSSSSILIWARIIFSIFVFVSATYIIYSIIIKNKAIKK